MDPLTFPLFVIARTDIHDLKIRLFRFRDFYSWPVIYKGESTACIPLFKDKPKLDIFFASNLDNDSYATVLSDPLELKTFLETVRGKASLVVFDPPKDQSFGEHCQPIEIDVLIQILDKKT